MTPPRHQPLFDAATVADESGHLQAYLAPGGRLPLVFPKTIVWFTAGPTTYELRS